METAERVVNIETTGNTVSGLFRTTDIAEANMLWRAIFSELETYAIDIVIFDANTSSRHDEVIALRLGQIVIDHSRFVPPEEGDFRTHIDVQGPTMFTTEHVPGLPFKFVTPIAVLKPGQRITCDVIVKKGQAKTHVKWRPVSTCTFQEVEGGYKFTMKEIGMLTGEQIFTQGLAKMRDAATRTPITIFSHQLVPSNIIV